MKLRYLIPSRDVSATIKELRERHAEGAKLVVYADDGEKFGAWPGTYQRVHKDGWLEQFFSAIAQADFIQTATLEDAWIFQKPARRIYLPGGAYPERSEGAAGEQRDYDVDGYDEYIFRGNIGAVFVHVQGGAIIEWDLYPSATNLVDTIARRPEAEHEDLRRAEKGGKVLVGKAAEKDGKSIHEGVRAKERGLSKMLEYDPARRALFQDSFRIGKAEPIDLSAIVYTLSPQREARTVSLALEPPALISTKPIYAISNSENGFERIYEQLEIATTWNVEIEPDGHVDLEIRGTAIGQMVEPEVTRPTARRRKAVAAGAETAARPRR